MLGEEFEPSLLEGGKAQSDRNDSFNEMSVVDLLA